MKNLLSISLLLAVLVGCSTTPTPEEGGAPVESRSGTDVKSVVAGGLDASGLPRELTDPNSPLSKRSIYFDVDKYEVKGEYQAVVAAHAKYLVANRGFKVLIQGNTDETGSREYNLSLGQKRADAVKRALVLLGAREDQVESVSLGEEKPKNPGHDESAYAENRRADVLYRAPDGRGEF
ncbi:peptidoglycan-associated lipoprotein [Azonexus fungiphilus]|jgi:peptidoglycan-associated lipoprotein|uniref:Peptidoglycan-associated lipoprotein n=1 Tax=Azonexus fungiphilus TaxID=146940 RepID=A0A495VPL0_9RHOO|nr:peptidoglycan-associated lipoprotein Pal [Azonexus fungiphilus]NHC08543.1 peptidoglycan-associated lipoprotein Pal [Azonexus fungiphilus]RKT51254.1 peptidoglycan-associated lipoprotein [Azonexus fungiphilus]